MTTYSYSQVNLKERQKHDEFLATPHTCWCPECQTPFPNRKLSGICWFVLQRQLSGCYSEAWCPSLELPASHKGAPGSPVWPNHFTDTWPAFFEDKKKGGTMQASLSCRIQQERRRKVTENEKNLDELCSFLDAFYYKGSSWNKLNRLRATHCEMQILLLQLDIHKSWIWAFSQLTLQLCPLPHSDCSGSFCSSVKHLYLSGTSLDHNIFKPENANGVENHILYLSSWMQLAELSYTTPRERMIYTGIHTTV